MGPPHRAKDASDKKRAISQRRATHVTGAACMTGGKTEGREPSALQRCKSYHNSCSFLTSFCGLTSMEHNPHPRACRPCAQLHTHTYTHLTNRLMKYARLYWYMGSMLASSATQKKRMDTCLEMGA